MPEKRNSPIISILRKYSVVIFKYKLIFFINFNVRKGQKKYDIIQEKKTCVMLQKNIKTCKVPITCKKKGHQEKRLDPNFQNNGEEKLMK